MSDGISEMNKEKLRIQHTTLNGITVEVVDEPKIGNTCIGCCFWNEGCEIRGDEIDTDLCTNTASIFKDMPTPLDKARERLEQAGTPLVADVRTFDTGATRDTDEGKPRYHAYSCPLVDQKRGEYMLKHQNIGTDKERIADNWKKRMPLEEILESLIRHVKDLELHHDGYVDQCREKDIHEVLDGIWANTTFYHHGIIQDEIDRKKPF